jgi:BirA family biotin operon repressor/biotin-[acetyl-CoA-carboxylase] ligase
MAERDDADLLPLLEAGALPAGWRLVYQPSTGSTNDDARQAALLGEPDATVFLTNLQQTGRGRQGRTWTAPPGFGLLFSVLFRPTPPGAPPLHFTMLAAVSVAEALEALGLQPAIKWPNDVMLGDRKTAGILAEAFGSPQGPVVVVGCGLNVGDSGPLPKGLPETATSVARVLGRRPDRAALFQAILAGLGRWRSQPTSTLRQAWHSRLWGRQQVIRAVEGSERLEGRIEEVADDGTLTLRLLDGRLTRLVSGEILL